MSQYRYFAKYTVLDGKSRATFTAKRATIDYLIHNMGLKAISKTLWDSHEMIRIEGCRWKMSARITNPTRICLQNLLPDHGELGLHFRNRMTGVVKMYCIKVEGAR